MIRFVLAGAAVWAAERAVRWFVGSYEPRHSTETQIVYGGPTRVEWRPTASVFAPEDNYRDLGRGVLVDELIGEEA